MCSRGGVIRGSQAGRTRGEIKIEVIAVELLIEMEKAEESRRIVLGCEKVLGRKTRGVGKRDKVWNIEKVAGRWVNVIIGE